LILFGPPFQLPPAGTSTKLSRGIDKMNALLCAALMWMIMIVSDRDPSGSSMIWFLPDMSSEPSIRKFIGAVLVPNGTSARGRSPRMSSRVTLFSYRCSSPSARPTVVPVQTSASTPTTVRAETQGDRLRLWLAGLGCCSPGSSPSAASWSASRLAARSNAASPDSWSRASVESSEDTSASSTLGNTSVSSPFMYGTLTSPRPVAGALQKADTRTVG